MRAIILKLLMDEKVKAQIKVQIEVLRLCAIFLLATGGSTITLIISGDVFNRKSFFIVCGILLSIVCLVYGFKSLKKLIKLTS